MMNVILLDETGEDSSGNADLEAVETFKWADVAKFVPLK